MQLFDARVTSPVKRWADLTAKVNRGGESILRDELLSWAYTSKDIQEIVGGDLLLYDFGLALFRKQTEQTLGTSWLELDSQPAPQSVPAQG